MRDCKMVCNASKDMISNLPRDVIERILMVMPLQDAAKISILSKKWRYNWATLPQLVFDTQFFEDVITNKPKYNEMTNIVNEVLLLHIGPIHKFVLCLPECCYIEDRDVDRWILFLSRNGVRELTLDNLNQNSPRLPSYLFSCQDLTHLKLCNFTFKPPPAFQGFQYLRSLELRCVTFTTDIFETLISNSPLLESFSFIECNGIDHLNIHAPNLKYLYFFAKSVHLINTLNLAEVSIGLLDFLNGSALKMYNLNEVMSCMPRVEKLDVNNVTLKVWATGGVPKQLATTPNFLKILGLHFINFHDVDQISCALCLIRSSLNLEELVIWNPTGVGAAMEPALNFMGKQECADCTLNKLREVFMEGVWGSKPELEFIKYILARSPILELMNIVRSEDIDANAESRMSGELMQYPRASPKAEVIYLAPSP